MSSVETDNIKRIIDTLPIPASVASLADGSVLYINAALAKAFDVDRTDAEGLTAAPFYVDPGARAKMVQELKQKGELRGYKSTLRAPGGGLIRLTANYAVIQWGETPAVFGVATGVEQLDES